MVKKNKPDRSKGGFVMFRRFHTVALVFILAVVAGCASPQQKKHEEAVFFPPAPNLPRFQFLVSYSGAKEIEAPKGAFEVFVTGEEENKARLDKPYGVAAYNGKVYVCDTNATVMVFDLARRTFEPLKGAKGLGKLIQPLNVSIDGEGNKYVTDAIRQQVVVFDKNDNYLKVYGKQGDWKPVDAVSYQGKLYVADIRNAEIKVFDMSTGEIVKTFGRTGKAEDSLHLPTNLAFDSHGDLFVVDTGRFQVVKYDRDGHFLGTLGSLGRNLGHFSRPRGIAIDRGGRTYVVDASFYNVQIFNDKGQLLLFFGEGGTRPGNLILPASVFIDYDDVKYFKDYIDPNFEPEYLVLVTSQFGDRMVNVFAFGKEKDKKYPTEQELIEEAEKYIKTKQAEEPPKPEEGTEEKQ
jgi:hypothetical protein